MGGTTTGAVNEVLYYIAAFSFLLFFAIVFFMVYFTVRYRKARNPEPTEIHGKPWLEVLWVVLPTLLALSMFMYGLTGYRFLRNPPPGALEVTVHSRQWVWGFEYENGRTSPDLVVPSGRDVRLSLTSDDVIHGFYVPDYRVQVDAVPGMKTQAWLKAGALGVSDILCTVYCGTAHSAMMAKLYVVPPDKYEAWYSGQSVELGDAVLPAAQTRDSALTLLANSGCLSCHSLTGEAGIGPSLKGIYGRTVEVMAGQKDEKLVADEEYLRRAILDPGSEVVKGFENIMPKITLGDSDLDRIIDWLKGE